MLKGCDCLLTGILEEVTKVNKLLDVDNAPQKLLVSTINLGIDRCSLDKEAATIFNMGIKKA